MIEKRRDQRKQEENKLTLELFSDERSTGKYIKVNALTQDISLSGIRVQCDKSFPVGTVVKTQITLSKSRKLINLDGKIVWVNDVQDGEFFEMGIQFIDALPHKVMVLLQHLFGNK